MNQVKIELAIDATNLEHVNALNNFLKAIGGQSSEQPAATVTTSKPRKTTKPKAEKEQEQPAETETTTSKEEEEVEIKITDVRALVAKKRNKHREAMKEKLTELGAENVTTLKAENYEEFMNFLNELD